LSELSVGVKPDWGSLEYSLSEDGFTDIRDCEITLSWGAFESFTPEEWMDNVRHELIHVEEIQKYGASNHGWRFKQRAREVDASTSCPKFTEYKYKLYCKECDEFVSGKYKKSKMVKNPNKYITRCCDANLYVEKNKT